MNILFILLFIHPWDVILGNSYILSSKYPQYRQDYLVWIDYSKPIDTERLYLVNLKDSCIEFSSKVSHARLSGEYLAKDFSNVEGSKKSSLGLYLTENLYQGRHGLSLRIIGLTPGQNTNAYKRNIVFHSTNGSKTIWSWGCFSTSPEINDKMLPLIDKGCLVWVTN